MERTLSYSIRQNHSAQTNVEVPDDCPVCGRLGVFPPISNSFNEGKSELQVIFQCTNPKCKSFIVCWYNTAMQAVTLIKIEPPNLTIAIVPETIGKISPEFVSIYREAYEAKERGLSQIAGAGFRKAFEFLIKDYAKLREPAKTTEIENTFAGNVVKNFVPDPRIQAVANRALWIGNDETHYLRKWVDRDVTDLINLINLTIHWIEIEKASEAYLTEMPDN